MSSTKRVFKHVKAIQDFACPRTIKGVRSFLGMVSYYRKFIKNFASIAAPLHQLTGGTKSSKEQPRRTSHDTSTIVWRPEHQEAFETLKEKLINPPVLAFPTTNGTFKLNLYTGRVHLAILT
ncbi:unnamed protein product [Didymodactylos carnosus]|uniref:Reverse transcriptase/retrotransposon-derived protein RNase H-like domain-containing protein n=1 Tax=Didymodactylos carnosus TaxID=1234261 RepID=A0A815E800_9BILA|nr:unnamed protein product [Didymodactylos carnosus]CAF1311354.1 unnamed protein product [Didymodactylos carnosus]CAF3600766.1 unnamed protein product [Didymodactylos carnosus]CAF4149190.1 unnamed protein product [Didymodactylos carnosus]